MEVSSLKIRPETFQLAERPMPFKRKAELRRELVIEYIKSRPYGQRIRSKEIQRVAQLKTEQSAYTMLKRMEKAGQITRHNIGLRSFFYTVPGEMKVSRQIGNHAPPRKVSADRQYSFSELEQLAKNFSWENPEHSNNLRRFIGKLKGDR